MTSGQERQSERGPDMSRFLPDALRFLTGEGRNKSPEMLLDGLHQRFREAGRERLADLVYEMVRSVLSAFPDFAQRSFHVVVPRSPEVISGEMKTMNECLQGVSDPEDLSSVARSLPAADQALEDAHKCLVVLEHLGGRSDRHQLATALYHIHRGEPLDAEPLLRAIVDDPGHSDDMRWYARTNLSFSLHRQGRSAEAIGVAQAALDERPDIPTPYFNLVSSAAEAGDRAVFVQSLAKMGALYRSSQAQIIKTWLETERGLLAEQMDMRPEEVDQIADLTIHTSDNA
jgi:hypothetical protein